MYANYRAKLPRLNDYAQALQHEAEITPIRGSTTKPIGVRRNRHMDIRKEGENVICRLYETDVVTYRPSGEIVVRLDGWPSNTTCGFITDLLGRGFYIFDNRVWVQCKSKDVDEGGAFPLHNGGENVFVRNEHGSLVFTNPAPNFVHKVNRKATNNVRKQYAGMRKYIENMFKLRANENGAVRVSDEEVTAVFGEQRPEFLSFGTNWAMKSEVKAEIAQLLKSTEPADQYKAFLWMCVGTKLQMITGLVTKGVITEKFDDLIRYMHRDEVFVTESRYAEQVRDRYAKYFG